MIVIQFLFHEESLSPLPSLADVSFRSCGKSVADVLCIICFVDCELQVCHCWNSACMITTAVSLSHLVSQRLTPPPPQPPTPNPPLHPLLSWLFTSPFRSDISTANKAKRRHPKPPVSKSSPNFCRFQGISDALTRSRDVSIVLSTAQGELARLFG
jgi:hypothetical protein